MNTDLQRWLATATPDQLQQIITQLQPQNIEFPDTRTTGQPMGTLANFKELLKYYAITIRHNEMTKMTEIDIPGKTFHRDTEMNAKIAELYDKAATHHMPDKMLMGFITLVANENAYHPVRDWIDAQVWDGQDRLQAWYDSVVLAHDNPMKEIFMRKWAMSLVAALYHDNFSCEGVLTYQSPQGKGKTSSIEMILPPQGRGVWNKDGVIIDTKNKDTQMEALGFWITELGEIDATFRKSDMEALKAFITRKTDVIRPPYERTSNMYQRRTVFYASVNELEFLQDDENRRFWVLSVQEFRPVALDVAQFWAQVKHLYLAVRDKVATAADREHYQEWGWFLSPQERARMDNLQTVFKSADPIEQILENGVVPDLGAGYQGESMNVTAILQQCGRLDPSKRDLNVAGKWLRRQGFVADRQKKYVVRVERKDQGYVFPEPALVPRTLKSGRDL